MTKKAVALIFIVTLCALASPPGEAQTLDKIRKQGAITLGYIDGAAPFSYADSNGDPQGYSVELCLAIAEGVAAQL
jgi:glutamate/aspartate transport system substrate-binding protein